MSGQMVRHLHSDSGPVLLGVTSRLIYSLRRTGLIFRVGPHIDFYFERDLSNDYLWVFTGL